MYKHILANLGFLLQIAGSLVILPILVGLYLSETGTLIPLFLTCISFFMSGFLMNALAERKNLDSRCSCVLILVAFLVMPLIAAIPFAYSDPFNSPNIIERFTNAYFESVSGFTTTGFSFISDSDSLSRSLLLYRSLQELMGGVGVVFLFLAFFHSKKSLNGLGEALGIESIENNLKRTFFSVLVIYSIYIIAFALIFYIFGFQDIAKTFSFIIDTITGGYAPSPEQFEKYLSIPTLVFIVILMFLGSVNFSFNYHLFTRKLRKALTGEIILYLIIITIGTILIVFLTGKNAPDSLFHVISMSSSTGFEYISIPKLSDPAKYIFILIMVLGGCSFSMAGGIKVSRIISTAKFVKQRVEGLLTRRKPVGGYSKMVKRRRMIKASINSDDRYLQVWVTIAFFVVILFGFSFIFSWIGISFIDALFEVGSALTTNGISMGVTKVSMPIAYKWLLISAMIIGRVEIITILVALGLFKKID